jgi:uncharacterized membrane protein YcaP (DUF421 family)
MSEITYYDYISGITLGAIAGASSANENVNIYGGMLALIIWALIPILLSYINMKSVTSKRLTGGKPLILIRNGNLDNSALTKSRYTIEDLLMQLRKKDVFNLSQVEFAILEIDGELSVLKKAPYNTVTPKDLKIAIPYKGLTIDLIINGRVLESNLSLAGKDKTWLMQQLQLQNVKNIMYVIYAGLTSDGKLELATTNQ